MTAVWIRVRAEFRSRSRAIIALAVMIGLAAGVVMAATAGGRRTESAYPRFVKAQQALSFVITPSDSSGLANLDEIARLPEVVDSTTVWSIPGIVTVGGEQLRFPEILPLVDPTNAFGTRINRFKILSGRTFDPHRPNEAVLSSSIADRLHVKPGDVLRFEVLPEDDQGRIGDQPVATTEIRVVGIEIAPAELPSIAGSNIAALHLSPAFAREHPEALFPLETSRAIRTRPGVTEAMFHAALARRGVGSGVDSIISQERQLSAITRSTRFESVALWLLAAIMAMAAAAVFGQALARQTFLEGADDPVLHALGMSRGQLLAVSLMRAVAIGAAAALIGLAVAVGLSPLTPTGTARLVEPTPGVSLDWLVLGIGALSTLAAVIVLAAVPAWRAGVLATRAHGNPTLLSPEGTSRVGNSLAGAGLPPTTVTGMRMALEPGRGRTSVPVRTTILGTTFALVALVAAVTFSASINRLVSTPSLSGWNWDALVGPQGEPNADTRTRGSAMLKSNPLVSEFADGTAADITIGAEQTFALAFEPVEGDVGPSIIEGRAPVAADEVALGSATLRASGAKIGHRVNVSFRGSSPRSMRVVGRVAMPTLFFTFNLPGQGAVLSLPGLKAFSPEFAGDLYFVRFAPSVSLRAGSNDLTSKGFFVLPRRDPQDLADLRRVAKIPVLLAGLLGLLSGATLAHTLLTSIRRRRRDLAILKTVGFVRRQVGSTVAWQASTLVVISLLIGIPAGIAAGRWSWRLFTDQLGVVPSPVLPALTLVIVGVGTLVLSNAVALLPGRVAARTSPAVVLRSE